MKLYVIQLEDAALLDPSIKNLPSFSIKYRSLALDLVTQTGLPSLRV